jgi:hypothetical protein
MVECLGGGTADLVALVVEQSLERFDRSCVVQLAQGPRGRFSHACMPELQQHGDEWLDRSEITERSERVGGVSPHPVRLILQVQDQWPNGQEISQPAKTVGGDNPVTFRPPLEANDE